MSSEYPGELYQDIFNEFLINDTISLFVIFDNCIVSSKMNDIFVSNLNIISVKLDHVRKAFIANTYNNNVQRQVIVDNRSNFLDCLTHIVYFTVCKDQKDVERTIMLTLVFIFLFLN